MDVINQTSEGDAAPDGGGFTGGAAVAQRVNEVMERSAAAGIPLGVVGMEGWQAVPDLAGLCAKLRRAGLHLSAYWNPFISPSSSVYEEAARSGYLVASPAGGPYQFINGRGSLVSIVDFTNPAAAQWWGEQIRRTLEVGFEGFMHDFGEQVSQPMQFHNGQPASVVHNAYPVLYHHAAREAVDEYAAGHPGFEPFFYVRSGFSSLEGGAGVTAWAPGTFAGDNTTDWSPSSGLASIPPTMLNLALGGCYAFTTDVGGFRPVHAGHFGRAVYPLGAAGCHDRHLPHPQLHDPRLALPVGLRWGDPRHLQALCAGESQTGRVDGLLGPPRRSPRRRWAGSAAGP
jgi:hypothetical protein